MNQITLITLLSAAIVFFILRPIYMKDIVDYKFKTLADLFAFLFGSGIGSSAIEKYPFSYQDLTSPHAQITRLLFEVGIAGFISWCCILFAPIKSFR